MGTNDTVTNRIEIQPLFGSLTFAPQGILSYNGDEDKGTASISPDGSAITLTDNAWKQVMTDSFTVTHDTVLQFDFSSTKEGEIHAIGFETDGEISKNQIFQLDGTQNWRGSIQDYNGRYAASDGDTLSYTINVGEYFTGDFDRIVLIMDDDKGVGADSTFSNIQVGRQITVDEIEPPNSDVAEVMAGRVAILVPEGLQAGDTIKILSGPASGNVTVNPDNTLALVMTMSDYTGELEFSYEVQSVDGSSQAHTMQLNVVPGASEAGWGTGEGHYMLQTDEDNKVIVEHGDNHRKVHVSNNEDALSIRDIAALEGLDESQITKKWLVNSDYGTTPELALKEDAGERLWVGMHEAGTNRPGTSDWLLFERGYEYKDFDDIIDFSTKGESELHPILISSYGEGDRPVLYNSMSFMRSVSNDIVIQDIEMQAGVTALLGENILIDHVTFNGSELNIQNVDGFTLRESSIVDSYRETPKNSGDTWDQSINRSSGIFGAKNDGVLIENTLWDHNGWGEGYDYNRSADDPQPPSYYSHNIYLQWNNEDVTLRDTVSMRAASIGAQVRSGGFFEDNILLDNNIGLVFHGGNYKGSGEVGNYSLLNGNVVTSGQHLTVDSRQGQTAAGIDNNAPMTSLVDNIVTHLTNPDDPSELEYKELSNYALVNRDDNPFYDNTVVFNWTAAREMQKNFDERNQNVEDLDFDVLYDTTIQRFTSELLGQEVATIEDLANVLRAEADGALDDVVDADLIAAYFREGFGFDVTERDAAETLRFIPNALGDGVRWDNRLNWDTDDLPGTRDGDSVDLAGNWVQYGGTTTLEDLRFGDGGKLNVTNGYLNVAGETSVDGEEAELSIDAAGQVWLDGYDDTGKLSVDVAGGRFANTGEMSGTIDLDISDNAQVLLGTDDARFTLTDDSEMHIVGGDAKVGFDGTDGGTSVLRLEDDATLGFKAQDDLFAVIEEFRSGHYELDAPDVRSGINLGNSNLQIDVTELDGGARTDILMEADEVVGTFGSVDVLGLGANRDARVVVDYENDAVAFILGADGAGDGSILIEELGDMYDAEEDEELWDEMLLL